ncbi:hypothetical protein D3C73_701300 [compost metagenome]
MTALGFGVAPGFLTLEPPLWVQTKLTDVACCEDVRRTGAQLRIDANALTNFQPGGHGQLGVGLHTNAHHDQVAGQQLAVNQLHRFSAGGALHRFNRHAQPDVHALTAMQFQQDTGQSLRQDATCQARPGFEQGHRATQGTGRRGDFKADKATANDHQSGTWPQRIA